MRFQVVGELTEVDEGVLLVTSRPIELLFPFLLIRRGLRSRVGLRLDGGDLVLLAPGEALSASGKGAVSEFRPLNQEVVDMAIDYLLGVGVGDVADQFGRDLSGDYPHGSGYLSVTAVRQGP